MHRSVHLDCLQRAVLTERHSLSIVSYCLSKTKRTFHRKQVSLRTVQDYFRLLSSLARCNMAEDFEWPWQYNFPPFFTLQPNLDTRSKQIEGWCDLILSYYKHHKSYILDVNEAQSGEIFCNKKIDRKLPLDAINLVLEELRLKGNIEWEDKRKQRCYVMWRTPDEWASLIFKWVQENGMTDTVCTLFELRAGDDTVNEEFYGIDMWMLKKSLRQLEAKGKAQMFEAPNASDESGLGVKFFS